MMFIVPCDPLDPRRPDERFAPEATAARAAGVGVALVDHEALAADDPVEGVRPLRGAALEGADTGDAVYRGWMPGAQAYAGMADALEGHDVTLRTSPQQHRAAHELPGWAHALGSLTPATGWTDGFALDALDAAAARLGAGPAVLRDYVKSLKHHWEGACFIPDTPDETPAVEGPGAVAFLAMEGARDAVRDLGLPFVTVDLVRRDDGRWRVVELGDGQVSDRPSSTDADASIAALAG